MFYELSNSGILRMPEFYFVMQIECKSATYLDIRKLAEFHKTCFLNTYEHLLPSEYLDKLNKEQFVNYWKKQLNNVCYTCVVWGDNRIVGFICAGKSRLEKYPESGEVFSLYIEPKIHSQGLGKYLLKSSFEWLYEQGYAKTMVVVLESNPAKFFYYHMGGVVVDSLSRYYSNEISVELVIEFVNS